MSDYQGNIVIKNPAVPTGPTTTGRAPGMWKLSDVAYWIKQGVWPNANISAPDTYFPYVSLLLSTTSLGNANNNLFVDSSGAFNPVSRIGNTTQGSFTPYSTNWSNYFDGSGDYLSVADNAALQFGTGNFTVECWVNSTVTTSTSFNTVIGKWGSSFSTTGDWSLRTKFSTNQVTLTLRYSSGWYDIQTGVSINDGAWHHIAAVRDSATTIKIYVDGTLRVTQTISASDIVGATAPVGIAATAFLTASEGAFTGYVSNARIVKGTAVYTANFTPSTTPLTAISGTSLLTCQSNRFRDTSSNNFTVTRNGDTTVTDFSPFNPTYPGAVYNQNDITNWSGYLNGSSYWTVPTSTALDVWDNGSGSFTVEAWIFATASIGNNVSIVAKAPNNGLSSWSPGWAFQVFNGYLNVNTPSDTRLFNSNTTSVPLNQWVHCALVKSGSTVSIYQNGVRVGTTTNSTAYSNTTDAVAIGVDRNFAGSKLTGYVSNVRMVKGTAVYDPTQSTLTVPTANLTAVSGTSLLTLQSAAFTDNSGNNYLVNSTGSPTVTGNSPVNTTGYWSNYFDGSGDYLTAPSSTAFALGTGDFTIEAWVYTSDTKFMLFSSQTAGGIGFGYNLDNGSQGLWVGRVGQGADATSGVLLTYNQWNHIAVTRQSNSVRFFVNGTQSGATQTVSTNYGTSAQAFYVGRDYTTSFADYAGYASNARLVKGTALYTSNFTVPTTPLTAVSGTSLLTCQNGSFIDNSSNAFTLTPFGNITVQPFDPFYTATIASNGGSMYFDGSGDYLSCPSNPAFNLGTSSYTVEFFIYTSSTTNQMVFDTVQPGISGGGSNRFFVYISSSQQVVVGPATNTLTSSSSIQLGAWNHVAVVRSGTTRTIYINGVSAGSNTQSEDLSSSFCTIGFDAAASGTIIMNGYLSNLRVTKGTAVYTSNFTPPTAPLTPSANTSLLTNGMNAGIYDATTINDMETVGNAQVRFPTPFAPADYWAGSFDGNGDYLSVADNAANRLGTGDFTVEFWVYGNSWSNLPVILEFGRNAVNNSPGIEFYVSSSGGQLDVYGGATTGVVLGSYSNLPTSSWVHVALTRASGSNRLFINGVQSGATTTNSADYTQATMWIGSFVGGGNSLNGLISNLRVVRGTAVYTSNFTPPTSPLTAISGTSFLTCQNKTFIDNSPNALTITANGNATAGAIGPFTATGGTSVYFDGAGDYLSIPNNPSLNMAGSPFTLECWICPNGNYSDYRTIMSKRNASTTSYQMFLFQTTGYLSFSRANTAYQSSATPTANVWSHVAAVYDGTNINLYLNGTRVLQTAVSIADTADPLLIGAIYTGGENFNGYIDDLRVTRGVARYTANFTPPTQPFPVY